MSEELEFEENIPRSAKVGYGFANAANMLLSGIGLGAINTFYTKVYNLGPDEIALSWMLFIVWNMVNDPLIGILEERTKSSLGRRIPYLRYGSIFYAISFIFIWFPFAEGQMGLMLNHLMMLFIFDTIYSMIGLVTYSLPAEMAVTSKERGSIMIYSTFIGMLGMAGSIIIPTVLLKGDAPRVDEYRIWMFIVAFVGGFTMYMSSKYIKENRYAQDEATFGFIESIKETLKNKQFLILEVAIFAMVIFQNVVTGQIVFLFDYILVINSWVSYLFVIPALFVVGYAFYVINSKIPKYGLKKITMTGAFIGAFGFVLLFIVGIFNNSKVTIEIGIIPICFIAVGLILFLLTNQPLMADAIDYDEVLTGKRRETTYSGVNALITKPAVSIGNALFFLIIGFYKYDENLTVSEQAASVSTGVLIAFSVVPAICLIIGGIVLRYFKLDGEEWNKKKREIQQIHIQKEKEYLERLKELEEKTNVEPKSK